MKSAEYAPANPRIPRRIRAQSARTEVHLSRLVQVHRHARTRADSGPRSAAACGVPCLLPPAATAFCNEYITITKNGYACKKSYGDVAQVKHHPPVSFVASVTTFVTMYAG